MQPFRLFQILVLAVLPGACATQPEAPVATAGDPATWPISWQVQRDRQHPLVARIWAPRAGTWVTPAQLRTAVGSAHFVVLGETHDNPDHHRLQAQLLQAVVDAGRRPKLAFEMLDLDQQPAIDAFLASGPADAAGLGAAVDWEASGWPAWPLYQPIADVAISNHLPIVAANLPAATVKAIAIEGFSALESGRAATLGLDQPLPAAWAATMREELYKSHCELVPRAALSGMIRAQRARNAIMAERMEDAASADGVVLIAGAGHARTDFAVPMLLTAAMPQAGVVSVAMLEVQPGENAPAAYAGDFNVPRLPFDYVVFTPAAEREDPCVALRKRFGHAVGGK